MILERIKVPANDQILVSDAALPQRAVQIVEKVR